MSTGLVVEEPNPLSSADERNHIIVLDYLGREKVNVRWYDEAEGVTIRLFRV